MFREDFCKNNRFLKNRQAFTICKAADVCGLQNVDLEIAKYDPSVDDIANFVKYQVQSVVEEIFVLRQGGADKIAHSFFTLH